MPRKTARAKILTLKAKPKDLLSVGPKIPMHFTAQQAARARYDWLMQHKTKLGLDQRHELPGLKKFLGIKPRKELKRKRVIGKKQ